MQKKDRIITFITGDDSFKAEHQFLNISLILGAFFFLFFLLVNIYFRIDIHLGMIKTAGIILSLALFYYARFKRAFTWPSLVFFAYLNCSYFLIGIWNGGVTGGIAPIYTAILALMLFIVKGRSLNILFTMWILSISGLFLLEYLNPEFIIPYNNHDQKYLDLCLSYASGMGMITMVVILVKRLYLKEKLNVEEMMIKYRSYSTDIKQKIAENKKYLSIREREICEQILKGMSNQEIAEELYISQGTVKCHINNIYKKLGAKKRVEIIDHYPEPEYSDIPITESN